VLGQQRGARLLRLSQLLCSDARGLGLLLCVAKQLGLQRRLKLLGRSAAELHSARGGRARRSNAHARSYARARACAARLK
jgi:hypothetical protein